jgi:hypothetical protein
MPDTTTTHYAFVKPEISASHETWGNKWNANLDDIDEALNAIYADNVSKTEGGTYAAPIFIPTPTLDMHAATKKYVDDAIRAALPPGCVIEWYGTVDSIPAGWALCNGLTVNGYVTPDLIGKFTMGGEASGTWVVGATGGTLTHDHGGNTGGTALTEAQLAVHDHSLSGGVSTAGSMTYTRTTTGQTAGAVSGGGITAITGLTSTTTGVSGDSHSHGDTFDVNNAGSGSTHLHSIVANYHLPPYRIMAKIMKVS